MGHRPFPRVLVLCHEPINRIGGGGVTMGNLFRGWPRDSLAQIWGHHRFEIDEEVCSVHLRLGAQRMPGDAWVPKSVRRQRRLVKQLRAVLRPGLRLDYGAVLAWAREFEPDLIYSQVTAYPMFAWWLPRWLSRDLGVGLINHIMDDWPPSLVREWPPVYRQIATPFLRRELARLFGAAIQNLAICGQMAAEFEARYGWPFIPFHNMVDFDLWAEPKQDYRAAGDQFRVVYLGALAQEMQVLSLREVAWVVSSLAREGAAISLTVHTGDVHRDCYDQFLGGLPAVSHGGAVAREDLCACLAGADLLVLPVNFGREGISARWSMPTKVPEYMASGTPVLVYAPSYVPPADYAQKEGWGYVVGERDRGALERALRALMASEELRARLGRRGRALARQNHDAHTVRAEFRRLLRASARLGAQGSQ